MITTYQRLQDTNAQDRPESKALQHGQFVSRIFSDASGQQFRLTFFVTIVAGEAKGHLVSAQPIGGKSYEPRAMRLEGECSSDTTFCLPCAPEKILAPISYLLPTALFISPYFSLDFLINSQPTRAPSYK